MMIFYLSSLRQFLVLFLWHPLLFLLLTSARLCYPEPKLPGLPFSKTGHFWTVEYDECEQTKNAGMSCQQKRVNIGIGFLDNKKDTVMYPGFYFNPLGMVVYEWQDTTAM